jgi:hypothetical protein
MAGNPYWSLFDQLEKIEVSLSNYPEISSRATRLFPTPTLERPICIAKSLCKLAADMDLMRLACEKAHIMEEIELLEKDLSIIKQELTEGEVKQR